jgi:hypothetical protein
MVQRFLPGSGFAHLFVLSCSPPNITLNRPLSMGSVLQFLCHRNIPTPWTCDSGSPILLSLQTLTLPGMSGGLGEWLGMLRTPFEHHSPFQRTMYIPYAIGVYVLTCHSPGRFYAAAVMKVILAQMIFNYDCELEDTQHRRWISWRSTVLPKRSTLVRLKPIR